jgi:prophage antirepressor-like protein
MEVKIYKHDKYGKFLACFRDDMVYITAMDVAKALDYQNRIRAIWDFCEDRILVMIALNEYAIVINYKDVNRLMAHSSLTDEEIKEFDNWLISEIYEPMYKENNPL